MSKMFAARRLPKLDLYSTRSLALALSLGATMLVTGCLSGSSGDSTSTGGASSASTPSSATGSATSPSSTSPSTQPGSPTPSTPANGPVVKVGPTQTLRTLAEAAAVARDGDTIEIDAGTYRGDVATFTQKRLTLRGVGGRPIFDANGTSAGGKAILVLHGEDYTIENLELDNCTVPDNNGAGIRHETGRLVVKNVIFRNNQEGILTGNNSGLAATDPRLSLEVYDSVFAGNGDGIGFAHNIYVGQIDSFVAMGNYFTLGKTGHLMKTRAAKNLILYNRITDEGGNASYEIDLPNGGESYLIGNLVEQSALSPNRTMVSYAAEGAIWPKNELYLSHNTIVSHGTGPCTYVRTAAGTTAKLVNNLLIGGCGFAFGGTADQVGSTNLDESEFVNAASFDFHLRPSSSARGTAASAGSVNGQSLVPAYEYRHTASKVSLSATPTSPGAFQ